MVDEFMTYIDCYNRNVVLLSEVRKVAVMNDVATVDKLCFLRAYSR